MSDRASSATTPNGDEAVIALTRWQRDLVEAIEHAGLIPHMDVTFSRNGDTPWRRKVVIEAHRAEQRTRHKCRCGGFHHRIETPAIAVKVIWISGSLHTIRARGIHPPGGEWSLTALCGRLQAMGGVR